MSKVPSSPTFTATDVESFRREVTLAFQLQARAINFPDQGATAARPTQQLVIGQTFFDTTIGKPIWWKGATWVDATGTPA